MGKSGNVLESTAEESGGNPARILRDPSGLRNRSRLEEIGMETEHAAASGNVRIVHIKRKQKGVGEQRHVQSVRGEIPRNDVVYCDVVKEKVEEQVQHQHERAAVRGGSREIRARLDNCTVG